MPLADFRITGALGGVVQGEEHEMRQERFDVEQEQRKLELRKKAMEVEDYEAETPARRSEYEVREQRSTREIGLEKELDTAAEEKVSNEILQLEMQQETTKLNMMYNLVQGAQDETSYAAILNNVTPAQREQWGLTGNFKKDKATLKYIGDRAQHSLSQLQEMEKINLRGQWGVAANAAGATGQNTFTPPGMAAPLTGDPMGQIQLSMMQDPDFAQLYTNPVQSVVGMQGDPTTSEEFQQASTMAMEETQSLLQDNEQQRRNTKKGTVPRLTWAEAVAEGQERTKAFLYEGVETTTFGQPYVKLMSPQDAREDFIRWKQQYIVRFMNDRTFRELSPSQQNRIMKLSYIRQRRADLTLGKRRVLSTVSNRSE